MNLLMTFIVACVIIALAFVGFMIGWFFTGKPFSRSSCGGVFNKKKNADCGDKNTCELCSPKKKD